MSFLLHTRYLLPEIFKLLMISIATTLVLKWHSGLI